jgi:hypothetical protein
VVADGWLAEAEGFCEVADTGFALGLGLDQAKKSESSRISEHFESGSDVFCVLSCEGCLGERGAAGGNGRDGLHAHILTRVYQLRQDVFIDRRLYLDVLRCPMVSLR